MSTREATGEPEPIIEGISDLVAPMIAGEKPKDQWRIGTEHEKFVYHRADRRAPSYDEKHGIRELLLALQ